MPVLPTAAPTGRSSGQRPRLPQGGWVLQVFRGGGASFRVWMQPCLSQQLPQIRFSLRRSPLHGSRRSPASSARPIWHTQQLPLFAPFQVGTIPRSADSAADSFPVLGVGSRGWRAVSAENSSQTFASRAFQWSCKHDGNRETFECSAHHETAGTQLSFLLFYRWKKWSSENCLNSYKNCVTEVWTQSRSPNPAP